MNQEQASRCRCFQSFLLAFALTHPFFLTLLDSLASFPLQNTKIIATKRTPVEGPSYAFRCRRNECHSARRLTSTSLLTVYNLSSKPLTLEAAHCCAIARKWILYARDGSLI